MSEQPTREQLAAEVAALRARLAQVERAQGHRFSNGIDAHAVLDLLGERIVVLDTELRVLWANRAARQPIGGKSPDGCRCFETWPRSDEPCDGCPVLKTLKTGETHDHEISLPTGQVWHLRGYPLHDEQGSLVGAVEVQRDVTGLAPRPQRRRLRPSQHTQKLNRLGIIAGGIAHDFNNLIMAMLGNASLALRKLPADSPALPHVDQIEATAGHAAEITRQLLSYAGEGHRALAPVHLSTIAREVGEMLAVSISKRLEIRYALDEELPVIVVDPAQVRQLTMNLLTNAAEAMGGQAGVIELRTGQVQATRDYLAGALTDDNLEPGPYAFIEVSDGGCGMDRGAIDQIFDPFFTTKVSGRGLGLASVLGVVRGHLGAIFVESQPGDGTTFRALFPVVTLAPTETPEPAPPVVASTPIHGRLLVVDDDEMVRQVTRGMLESEGYEVQSADGGNQALEIFAADAGEFDAVLLDLSMPGMGGEETFVGLRQIRPDVRVLLCSGFAEKIAKQRFAGLGVAGFLQKPYRYDELMAKVAEILALPATAG